MVDLPVGAFVRVMIDVGDPEGRKYKPCWGMTGTTRDFIPLWCEADARDQIDNELGELLQPSGLLDTEYASITEADDTNTPPEAWAALAYYRMTGKIAPELVNEVNKGTNK